MSASHRMFGRAAIAFAWLLLPAAFVYGKDVTLVWDANTEPDLAGYKVYQGTASRKYTVVTDVGKVTSYTVRGLGDGTYYFALTAYNLAGLESTFSNEVFSGSLTLVYPRLAFAGVPGADEYTGIALANLGQTDGMFNLTALDQSGSQPAGAGITNPALVTLYGGQQRALLDYQLFGAGLAGQSPLGWVKIDCSVTSVSGFFLMFDGNRTVSDGGTAYLSPKPSAVLTEVRNPGFTKLNLINPNPEAVVATIELVGSDGSILGSSGRTIPAKGTLVAGLSPDVFPGLDPSPSDYVRVRSNPGIIASQLTGKTGAYIEFLQGQDTAAGATSLYSPQYAVGGEWRSTISMVNLESLAGTVTLRLIGENGSQLGTTRTLPIAANGKVLIDDQNFFGVQGSTGSPALTQGYVEITSSGMRMTGSVVFGDPGQNSYSTVLPLVSEFGNSLIFAHVASSDIWYTGLAIVNPGQGDANATLDVLNADGSTAMSKAEVIPAKRRVSGLLTQFFPALEGQERTSGYIRLTVDKPVAAFALFGTNNGAVLSAIPGRTAP